jgi:hypothetical protein
MSTFLSKLAAAPVLILIVSLTGSYSTANSPNTINKNSVYSYKEIDLFSCVSTNTTRQNLQGYLSGGSILRLNTGVKNSLLSSRNENISLKLTLSNGEKPELLLTRCQVHTDDFKTASISHGEIILNQNYEPGLYYRGIIKGCEKSFASLTIFDEYVMGLFSYDKGNYNLSRLNEKGELYLLFNDEDLALKDRFKCQTPDNESGLKTGVINLGNNFRYNLTQGPIREYVECDYKMYQDFGSNITRVNNYISAVYNSVIAVYQAEQISTLLNAVYVWTVPDIYSNTNSLPVMIKRFGARIKNSFNGHMALLASTRTNTGGGFAWVDVLCSNFLSYDSSGPYAVTIIDTMLRPFPVYSWVINVITHEMGHNIGSRHTHSCMWPGGPIDTCYYVEGGCYSGPLKPKAGTIMSYCHLYGSVNLSFGFGPLPGNFIRQRYNNAPCLIGIEQISSEIPEEFELKQNYPNPFNPKTQIIFSVHKKAYVSLKIYDVNGKEIYILSDKVFEPGFYRADWEAGDLPSGVYFYRLTSGNFDVTRKMILIK